MLTLYNNMLSIKSDYNYTEQNMWNKYRIFSIDNAHPKLFRHFFWCIDKARDVN
jgi:hypothetical protein